jgi:hypothetical protein
MAKQNEWGSKGKHWKKAIPYVDIVGVTGSIPVAPTILKPLDAHPGASSF